LRITVVPSSPGPPESSCRQYLTSYLVNDFLAIDAGSIGVWGDSIRQARVRHLFISHTHIDHLASLPGLLENRYDDATEPVTVYAAQDVLDCLESDIFNGRLWPKLEVFAGLPRPLAIWRRIEPGTPVEVEGIRVTPLAMNHVVPTVGFVLESPEATVIVASDTGPTEDIWRHARQLARLDGVFLEVTFPDEMADIATAALHLTPQLFAAEVGKVGRPTRWIVVHIKPRCFPVVVEQLATLGIDHLEIGQAGRTYEFGEPAGSHCGEN